MSTYSVVIWKLIGDNEIPADAPIVEIIRTDELIPKKSDDGKNHVSMGYKGALWHGVIDSQHATKATATKAREKQYAELLQGGRPKRIIKPTCKDHSEEEHASENKIERKKDKKKTVKRKIISASESESDSEKVEKKKRKSLTKTKDVHRKQKTYPLISDTDSDGEVEKTKSDKNSINKCKRKDGEPRKDTGRESIGEHTESEDEGPSKSRAEELQAKAVAQKAKERLVQSRPQPDRDETRSSQRSQSPPCKRKSERDETQSSQIPQSPPCKRKPDNTPERTTNLQHLPNTPCTPHTCTPNSGYSKQTSSHSPLADSSPFSYLWPKVKTNSPKSVPGGLMAVTGEEISAILRDYARRHQLSSLNEEVRELRSEVKSLRRTLKNAASSVSSHAAAAGGSPSTGGDQNEIGKSLQEKIADAIAGYGTNQIFYAVDSAMRLAFSDEELVSHSVSGKASNSKMTPKPVFDKTKHNQVLQALYTKFPQLLSEKKELTLKIHSVIKKAKKRLAKAGEETQEDI